MSLHKIDMLYINTCIHLFIYPFICLFIHPFICLFIHSFVYLFIHSFFLFIYSLICLFIHSFVYLSIYLYAVCICLSFPPRDVPLLGWWIRSSLEKYVFTERFNSFKGGRQNMYVYVFIYKYILIKTTYIHFLENLL